MKAEFIFSLLQNTFQGSQHVEKTRESIKNRSLHAFIEENMDMSHIILAVV